MMYYVGFLIPLSWNARETARKMVGGRIGPHSKPKNPEKLPD
jgi:hypothetical protein